MEDTIMKKRLKKMSIYLLSASLICTPVSLMSDSQTIVAQAHSGRTDANGGHKDNKNKSGLGSYHYHCGGYPAHLHEGGVCPYSSTAVSSSAAVSSDESASSGNALTSSSADSSGSGKLKLSTGTEISLSEDIIKIAQDVLNEKGYDCGTPDGIAGEKTKEAIQAFLADEDPNCTDHMIIAMIAEALQ